MALVRFRCSSIVMADPLNWEARTVEAQGTAKPVPQIPAFGRSRRIQNSRPGNGERNLRLGRFSFSNGRNYMRFPENACLNTGFWLVCRLLRSRSLVGMRIGKGGFLWSDGIRI